MNWKELESQKKYFIIIGIPCFLFVFFILFNFYILFTTSYLMFLVVLLLGLIRKEKIWNRLTKISIIMVIMFFINYYNFTHISTRFERNLPGSRQSLLEPDHPEIKKLEKRFLEWHLDKYNITFDSLNDDDYEDLQLKMRRLDYYIHTEVIEYTYDSDAPYYDGDYTATLDEIFESDTDGDGLLQDDCDGITVVTVSLLLHMGYNAYVSECLSHWNSIVFPEGEDPHTVEGFNKGIHLYNPWGRPSYYIFNEEELFTPPDRPIYVSMYELFIEDKSYGDYIDFVRGYYLPFSGWCAILLSLLLLYAILCLIAIIMYHIVRIGLPQMPSIKEKKLKWFINKSILKTIFYTSLIASFIAFLMYWFIISILGSFATLLLCGAFIIGSRYVEYRIKRE
ncbi:MAG: hypothetical protein ACTSR8_05320 [Promethearchaeota archaeon]